MDEEFEEGNIDDLFERLKDSGSAQEKADLAESYLDLFHELSYDFACDKFDDVEYLYTIVEKIEVLKGAVSWSLRAQAYSMQMDQAETNEEIASVISNGHLAIDALYNQLTEGEEKTQLIYQNLSHHYYTLLNYLPDKAIEYWKKSFYYSKESILENAVGANWVMYFTLLYSTSKQESNLLAEHRASEVNVFRNWCFSLNQGVLAYTIASQFIRFKMIAEDNEFVNYLFPEKEYLFWLEKSLLDEIPDFTSRESSDAGHFYKKEGVRLQRIDLLERALVYFEKVFYKYSNDGAFCVYYISDVLENIACIYKKAGLNEKAGAYITKAFEWNEEHYETIETSYSLLSHYAEFLIRSYDYREDVQIPSFDFILSILKQAEIKGDGYYSGPYFLQAQIALIQKNEHLAVASVSKALLLHELCIDNVIEEFYNNLAKGVYLYLEKFLESTLVFMKEIKINYCYNPAIKFTALNLMSDTEVIEAWIIRKGELRKKKNIE